MLPSLAALRNELLCDGAPTSVRLTDDDTVARRSDADHVRAMAVLAYSNLWDDFIQNHLTKKAIVDEPIPPDEAIYLAAIVAMFCPMDVLRKLLDLRDLEESEIVIKLGPSDSPAHLEPTQKRPACRLVAINPSRNETGETGTTLEELIVRQIVMPAMATPPSYKAWWPFKRTLMVLANTMLSQANPIGFVSAPPPRRTPGGVLLNRRPLTPDEIGVLWHGFAVPVDGDETAVITEFLETLSEDTGFVSTSRSPRTASLFAHGANFANKDAREFLLRIVPDPMVPVVDHYTILPMAWRCHLEKEVTIVPGCHYEITTGADMDDKDESWQRMVRTSYLVGHEVPKVVHVRVTPP